MVHHHGGGPLLYGIRKARREEGRALARQAARNPGQPVAPRAPKPGWEGENPTGEITLFIVVGLLLTIAAVIAGSYL